MDAILPYVPLVLTIVGAAIGFGAMRERMRRLQSDQKRTAARLDALTGEDGTGEAWYMSTKECDARHEELMDRLGEVKKEQGEQGHLVKAIERFVRWYLAEKEKMDLAKINKTLNGGG